MGFQISGGGDADGFDGAFVLPTPTSGRVDLADATLTIVGETDADGAGQCVANLGDLDGDGRKDLLVGAPYHDDYNGAAYLLYGPRAGTVSLVDADATFLGGDGGDYAGSPCAGPGDYDGDGQTDALIAAPNGGLSAGVVYVVPVGAL